LFPAAVVDSLGQKPCIFSVCTHIKIQGHIKPNAAVRKLRYKWKNAGWWYQRLEHLRAGDGLFGEIWASYGNEYEDFLRDVASYSLVWFDWRFRGAYCLQHQGGDSADDGVNLSISETLVYLYQAARRTTPEDSHFQRITT
jgi:hypothetical protein